jgi:O-antigen/teichoic acid export membrane protein
MALSGVEENYRKSVPSWSAWCVFTRPARQLPIEFGEPGEDRSAKLNHGAGGLYHIALNSPDIRAIDPRHNRGVRQGSRPLTSVRYEGQSAAKGPVSKVGTMDLAVKPADDVGQAPAPDPGLQEGEVRRPGGANLYFLSSIVAQAVALLRYVVMAHLLGPTQLGLVTTLVVTAAFFDLVGDTGGDRFIIQDRHGGDPDVQQLVQTTYVVRGMATALLFVAISVPVSMIYRQPTLVTGLCLMGLTPLVNSFLHMDTRRTQRWMDFRPEAICSIVSELAGLTAVLIAAWTTRHYTAIIFGLVTRALVNVVTSHIVSKRRYVLGWSRVHALRMAAFSGPLLLNGFMLFIGSQMDRVVVGNQLGVTNLGLYSAVLLLVYYPSALLVRSIYAMFIPLAAAARDDVAGLRQTSARLGGVNVGLAICMAAGFAVVAPLLVPLLYGERFRQTALLIGLIGILQTTRFLITWPTAIALAMGRSRSVLATNTTRLCVVPGAFVGLKLMGGLEGVLIGFICGELASVIVSLFLLNRIIRARAFSGFDRLGLFVLVGATIVAWNLLLPKASLLTVIALLVGTLLLGAVVLRREWRTLQDALTVASNWCASFVRRERRPASSA